MKPIAVFQHTEIGAPGTVVPILESMGRTVRVIRVMNGEAIPERADDFSGLVFMGGYMGVHDALPWIPRELALIREAYASGLPLAGHCLGSQMIAFALGGQVTKMAAPELGWQALRTGGDARAREWWGPYADQEIQTFQWHGDTFEPPSEAHQLASGQHCANQVFVLNDCHLLVQSHLEMTPELIKLYIERNGAQLRRQYALHNPAASDPADAMNDVVARTEQLRAALTTLYTRWVRKPSETRS